MEDSRGWRTGGWRTLEAGGLEDLPGDLVGVQPGPEGADVELVELGDPLQEGGGAGPDAGVVPEGDC